MILMAGGLFLLVKATLEIHTSVEGEEHGPTGGKAAAVAGIGVVIAQIIALPPVFSADSLPPATGMVDDARVMIAAGLVSIAVLILASEPIADFPHRPPPAKVQNGRAS